MEFLTTDERLLALAQLIGQSASSIANSSKPRHTPVRPAANSSSNHAVPSGVF
jgi:hypothetical protein